MKNLTDSTRRSFFTKAAGFGAALALPHSKVIGANDRIRVGVVGVNGRGNAHLSGFGKQDGVAITAVCDIDQAVREARVVKWSESQGLKVKGYVDMREMLDEDAIDLFTSATPNHWHTLSGIWALQAGKHAYIEKPISHNVWEGRQLVNLSRNTGLLCQGGTQSRSMKSIQAAVKYVHDGEIGKIEYVKGLCYKPRASIGQVGSEGGKIPDNVDYDKWCGPAPLEEPMGRNRFHYDWHWFYAYGNGDMGNQGIHQMDVARWFLGANELSPMVASIGGRLGYEDDGETPNTQIVYHAYEPAPLIFETRGLPKDKAGQKSWGKNMNKPEEFPDMSGIAVVVKCEGGYVYCSSGGKTSVKDNDGKQIKTFDGGGGDHFQNFIEAVRAGKREIQTADCEETHLSSALCHSGLISHQLGEAATDGEIRERIKEDKTLTARYDAMADHLDKNEVDINAKTITMGPLLKFDPKTELFEGNGDLDAAANKLATREYRAPYVVPEVKLA
ncbi:MAG: putative dehydrogenase [Verrucomicrobiales bacterium]|jgi:predicted dehydrogenase